MPETFRLKCWMRRSDSKYGVWHRLVTFPCFPYPGLTVGSGMIVKRVYVCQGDLDGGGGVNVQLRKTNAVASILERDGWKWEEPDHAD